MKPKRWNQIFFTSKPLWSFFGWFLVQIRMEKKSSPEISGDMVSLHNMVSPQNGDTRGGAPRSPPFLATPLLYHCYVYKYCTRGGVEDTRLEAKDTKKSEAKAKDSLSEDITFRDQGQKCSRPRPRTKDTGASVLQKN